MRNSAWEKQLCIFDNRPYTLVQFRGENRALQRCCVLALISTIIIRERTCNYPTMGLSKGGR
ncbi:hypothetical protein PISMIDRAFT_686259 [Pisolithus microcarpus 441]|uniref:Unplaced genomic scaffold scaffold_172, whole genome shotgun sequence n=1 Tax=Pisolithus microcarpus 441 TaxID=765257 RepID=A0A0C9YRL6_9AGAM|nr:hypothetical protein PISMIDRAFT_686259 [Pisolithus microcarpus 441]